MNNQVLLENLNRLAQQQKQKEYKMSIVRNPVQAFIRNFVRLLVFVPLWFLFAYNDFSTGFVVASVGRLLAGGVKTLVILWLANV